MDDIITKLAQVQWDLLSTNEGVKSWLMKIVCGKDCYAIALSDLSSVFTEILNADEVQQRCLELNKMLEAPSSRVVEHIHQTLIQHHNFSFNSQLLSNSVVCFSFSNSFYTGIPFNWKFTCKHLSSLDSEVLTKKLLCDPLAVSLASLLYENRKLKEIIAQKDDEIKDYRDSGYKVSRSHLKTDLFNEHAFKSAVRKDRDYASVVTKDPLKILSEKAVNDVLISASKDSQSSDIKSQLVTSPTKQKDAVPSSLANQSPVRKKRRKQRPTVRGCVLDTTDDSIDNHDDAPKVLTTAISAPTQQLKKTKKTKKKQLF